MILEMNTYYKVLDPCSDRHLFVHAVTLFTVYWYCLNDVVTSGFAAIVALRYHLGMQNPQSCIDYLILIPSSISVDFSLL